jgi:hypothetical protein
MGGGLLGGATAGGRGAGRLAAGGGIAGIRPGIPLSPEAHAQLLGQYRGEGAGGGAGMAGMDAEAYMEAQGYYVQEQVPARRYALAVAALVAIFVVGPALLLKSLNKI